MTANTVLSVGSAYLLVTVSHIVIKVGAAVSSEISWYEPYFRGTYAVAARLGPP